MGFSTEQLTSQLQKEVDEVFDIVQQVTGVNKTMLLSTNRRRFLVDARKILVCALREHVKLTCYQIGGIIGKDHSSIVHYDRMHKVHMTEPEYRRMYSAVTGTYLIYKSVQDEERLRHQFVSLQQKTKELLTALEGKHETLNETMQNIN